MSSLPAPAIGSRLVARKDTTLAPSMLVRPGRESTLPWVLQNANAKFHYLGRNASFALIRGLGLDGSELLFPSFFGPPVLQAPIEAGASVRFYPVRQGMEVRADDILAALTPQTRAIYLIHYNGFPAPIADVMQIARERNLIVIEDAAHALLTRIDGKPAGSIGDGGIWSFYKWAPVPNGAAMVANRPTMYPLVSGNRRSLTSGVALATFSLLDHAEMNWGTPGRHAKTALRWAGRNLSHATNLSYVPTGGVNFDHSDLDVAMSPIAHRVIHAQNWTEIARIRRRNYGLLSDLLADVAPPAQGPLRPGVVPLFYATQVENKRKVLARLAARGVEGRNFWELHHPALPEGTWSETDDLRRTMLELPIHQDLDPVAIQQIAAAVRAVLGGQST